MNFLTKQKQIHRLSLWFPGGRDSQGVWDGRGHTAVFNMENQQGPAGQPGELCSTLCNNLMVPGGRTGEGMVSSLGWTWTHGCVAEFLQCSSANSHSIVH